MNRNTLRAIAAGGAGMGSILLAFSVILPDMFSVTDFALETIGDFLAFVWFMAVGVLTITLASPSEAKS